MNSPRPGNARRLLFAAAAVTTLVIAVKGLRVQDDLLAVVGWVRNAGWLGVGVFTLVYIVATVGLVPGSILTLGAGFAYGVSVGTAIVWVAASLAATAAFLLGRTLARDWIAARVAANPRFAAIDQAVGREGFKIVLLTRLSPVFPFSLLNYAFGLTRVSLRDYVLGSVVGMLPGTVMYVYLGSLITSLSELAAGHPRGGCAQRAFYFAGLVVTVLVTLYVTRLSRRALSALTTQAPTSAGDQANTEATI